MAVTRGGMTGATFGRKGMTGAMPAQRRAPAFGNATPLGAQDELALRREAFLAAERTRRAGGKVPASTPVEARAQARTIEALAAALKPKPPETFDGKSYPVAFLLWMLLGIAGAHRLYLRRPISGGLQAGLFAISLALLFAGYYPAFLGLAAGMMWMLFDARLISRMSKAPRR